GKEMGDSNFTGCSIVTNPFGNANIRGQMAILGPTRLPYEQIKTILTNLNNDIDYSEIKKKISKNIIPAYDGLSFLI
ncbi:MAG: hypothetical protein QF447_08145, partial [Candidatus Thioglobus sp.]|nr:hypothetical protein [Candidatus Thioglobus sp.]